MQTPTLNISAPSPLPQHLGLPDQKGEAFSQDDMVDFFRAMTERKKGDPSRGDLKLRFYMDLPSIPLLIIESGKRHEEVYTGFYLNKFSSGMPYIEWASDEEGFIDNLYDYFDRKWIFSEKGDAKLLLQSVRDNSGDNPDPEDSEK